MNEIKKVSLFPRGAIQMPPSKSISHRALICSGLTERPSVIKNLAVSDDIGATARCMREIRKGLIEKAGQPGILDCGESGSTLRFLIPLAAMLPDGASFTGRGGLMERPLGPYLDELALHGASVSLRDGVLTVTGPLEGGAYNIPGNISSQFVTGLLLALPLLESDSEIRVTSPLESAPYVDITLDVMERFGIQVANDGYRRFSIKGGQRYRPCELTVEADYSQAAFFLVAGALGAECGCLGLSPESKQGDGRIVDILKRSGAKILTTEQGGLAARPGRLAAQTADVSDIPDLVPPLAAFFCFCEGTSHIINAGRLRHKESDRLTAVTEELNKLGAEIVMAEDSLTIKGVKSLRGGAMSARGDHRVAMMGAVAAIRSEAPVYIEGAGCVSKSYPDFWRDFEKEERSPRE